MKKLLLSTSVLFIFSAAFAQPLTFSKVYWDTPTFGIRANSVTRAFDNGYLIAGNEQYQTAFLLKVDSAGNQLWNKTYTGTGGAAFYSIIATNDSCFAAAGMMNDKTFCTKLNQTGDTLWTRTFQVGTTSSRALSICQTYDSGYVITGYVNVPTAPNTRAFVIKVNAGGALQWTTILTGGNNANYGHSIKQTADSGYIVVGYVENLSPFDPGAVLIKLTPTGGVTWAKKYSQATLVMTSGNDVEVTPTGYVCYMDVGNNVALVKTNLTGTISWVQTYDHYGSNSMNEANERLIKTTDGGFAFTNGDMFSQGGLTKTNEFGTVIWDRDVFMTKPFLVQSNDTGIFVAGNGPIYGVTMAPPASPQIGLIKTDSMGDDPTSTCITPHFPSSPAVSFVTTNISYTVTTIATVLQSNPVAGTISLQNSAGCVTFVGSVNEENDNGGFSVYPNPSNGIIQIANTKGQTATVEIYNMMGEKICSAAITNNSTAINLSESAKGIYFMHILTHGGVVTEKIVLE